MKIVIDFQLNHFKMYPNKFNLNVKNKISNKNI